MITKIKENFIKSVMVNDYIFINLVGLSIDAFVIDLAFYQHVILLIFIQTNKFYQQKFYIFNNPC